MVQQLLKVWLLLLMILAASCASIHQETQTRYQKKNLKKFSNHKRYFKPSGANKPKIRKNVSIYRQGHYWHPAVPKNAKKRIRFNPWLKKIGEGEIDY
jgi:UDP-2,3-diacylglucosamine pyrophosphatase LpxH